MLNRSLLKVCLTAFTPDQILRLSQVLLFCEVFVLFAITSVTEQNWVHKRDPLPCETRSIL